MTEGPLIPSAPRTTQDGPGSRTTQLALLLILFVAVSYVVLGGAADLFRLLPKSALPPGGNGTPAGHPSAWPGHGAASLAVSLAASLAVWIACALCVLLMTRITRAIGDDPPQLFTSGVIFAFLAFFVLERLTGASGLLPARTLWMEILSSSAVAAASALLIPLFLRKTPPANQTQAEARAAQDRFLAAAESSLDDFYIFDGVRDPSGEIVDFRFSYINPNAERRLNTSRESLIGKILTEVRPFMVSSGLIEPYREVVRTGKPFTCEVFIDDEMIKATWINVQVVKLGDGIAITSRDVTERKRLNDHVSYLAHHDQLTGLANRTLLDDRLRQAILLAQRHDQKVAVFMLDIDNFKQINDSLGHAGGDEVLKAVGKRLLSAVRESDTIARMGGDEFVIVMPEFRTLEDVERCGAQIVMSTARPLTIGDREIKVTLSVGVCIYPDCALESDQLLKNADAAMYIVKSRGRDGLHFFQDRLPRMPLSTSPAQNVQHL